MAESKKLIKTKCRTCGKEFEVAVYYLMGVALMLQPDCRDCCEVRWKLMLANQRLEWRRSIPEKFRNEDFATLDLSREGKVKGLRHAAQTCKTYAEKIPISSAQGYPSIIIFSEDSWGVGKTHISAAICNRMFDRWNGEGIDGPGDKVRPPAQYVSEIDLFSSIQATFNRPIEEKGGTSEHSIIYSLAGQNLLVIDDVGKRTVQNLDFIHRVYFAIIEYRYRRMLPVVITSNLKDTLLEGYLGKASYDRLWEMCQGRALQIEGESYRKRKVS